MDFKYGMNFALKERQPLDDNKKERQLGIVYRSELLQNVRIQGQYKKSFPFGKGDYG